MTAPDPLRSASQHPPTWKFDFGGWDGAGNAFLEPWTQPDGRVYVNVPKWSGLILRRS